MINIGDRVSYITDHYDTLTSPMCMSNRYKSINGTVLACKRIPELVWKSVVTVPSHISYTVECDDGVIRNGWDWRIKKI